jgi:putative nicotinate phosphoribosyltransferase
MVILSWGEGCGSKSSPTTNFSYPKDGNVPSTLRRTAGPAHGPLSAHHGRLLLRPGYERRGHLQPLYPQVPEKSGLFRGRGLAEALDYLATLHFSDDDLAYLESTGLFRTPFLDYLRTLRFTGEVYALPEGSIFFKDEPLLEVTAPIIEAQLVETFVINAVNLQTLIASKAARSVQAAGGRPLIDFSLRRTQGSDAGLKVARASYLVGFTGTSNVLAGKLYGIPIFRHHGPLLCHQFSRGD